MKTVKKKKMSKNPAMIDAQYTEKNSLIFWSIMTFIVLFLFFSPYSMTGPGLFNGLAEQFEGRIYGVIIWSTVCLFLLAIYFFWHWRLHNGRDLLSIAIWLIPLSYLLSFLISPASRHNAVNMLMISVLYAAFFLFGSYLTVERLGSKIVQLAIIVAGYFIVLFGFLNLFGNTYYTNAVMYDLVLKGIRFTSVFQYSNAYAAFVMAILFSSLYLMLTSRKWYFIMLHGLMVVPMLSSFWLTQTRGAYILLPIILLLILPLLSFAKQLHMILYLLIGALASFKLTDQFIAIGQPISIRNEAEYTRTGAVTHLEPFLSAASRHGWGRLFIGAVIVAAIIYGLQTFMMPWLERKFKPFETTKPKLSRFVLPFISIFCAVVGAYILLNSTEVRSLLPNTIQNRIEHINLRQVSVEERATFYQDAIKVVKDYPIFGAGGGAWAALYPKYESSPYISRQTHGFLLQYLVENGVLGLLLLLGILGAVFFMYLKSYLFRKEAPVNPASLIFYIIAVTLLAHSMIDFDLSYVYLAAILFLCLGSMSAAIPFHAISWPSWVRLRHYRWGFPSMVALISAVTLVMTMICFHANGLYNNAFNALQTHKNYTEVMTPLNQAIALRPHDPDFILAKVNILNQGYALSNNKDESYYNEVSKLLSSLHRTEPFNRDVWDGLYNQAIIKNQLAQALNIAKEAIRLFPWDESTPLGKSTADRASFYERAVELDYQLGAQEAKQADSSSNTLPALNTYWANALDLYQTVETKYEAMQLMPAGEVEARSYVVPTGLIANIGLINYSMQQYSRAIELLKPFIKKDLSDPTDAKIARIYLDSLHKSS